MRCCSGIVEGFNIGLINRLVDRPEDVLPEAINLAKQLSDLPQNCMRNDRLSAIKNIYSNYENKILTEFEYGLKSLLSKEAVEGTKLFAQGVGKHGKPLGRPKF